VVVFEKGAHGRDKVCGDGLTPRAVRSLIDRGVDISPELGWARNNGLRIIANGRTYELPWPELERFPNYGLVRARMELDEILAGEVEGWDAVREEFARFLVSAGWPEDDADKKAAAEGIPDTESAVPAGLED
jgi:flavin-dependent dehydrogenase